MQGEAQQAGSFVFDVDRAGTPRIESTRLANLVDACAPAIDGAALAPWALEMPTTRATDTPYRGVRASLREDDVDVETCLASSPRSAVEAVASLRAALDAAVDRALAGSRRAAVLAGGGVDSSVLLALTVAWARRTGNTAFAVALDFEGPGDDRPHLREVEAALGCEVVRVRPEDAAHRSALLWSGVDAAPFGWPTAPLEVEMLARAKDNGADRALTGAGGDELFNGDPRSLSVLARRNARDAITLARVLRGFDRPRFPALAWIARPMMASVVPRSLRAWRAKRHLGAPSWAGPTLRRVVREQSEAGLSRAFAKTAAPRARFDAFVTHPQRMHIAWIRHQEEVASGLARRDPFVDRALDAFVMTLRPEWLLLGGRRRGLLREAVRDLLPEGPRERLDKAAFEPALARFAAAAGGLETLRPLSNAKELAALGIVDRAAFGRRFDAFVARPEDGESWVTTWPTLAVEAFLRARPS